MTNKLAIDGGTPVRAKPFGPTHDFGEDDIAAVSDVIRSGNLGKGPKVTEFEEKFSSRLGINHAIAVNSGTAALHTCIGALNPDPGDEIIVTPWTSGGSIIGGLLHNCVPVFADIDDTYTIDPKDVESKITPRTRAIIAVHLFGNPCNMDALREIATRHQIFLIEDCSQAHFAKYQGQIVGTIGDINGLSLGGKHLSSGTGGIVLTNDEILWERAVLFSDAALPRSDGPYEGRPYANYFLAPNYKLNDLQAAVLLVQLNKVGNYIENKIRSAHQIIEELSDIEELTPQEVKPGNRHTYWSLGFTINKQGLNCSATEFAKAVSKEGVPLGGPYIGSGKEGPLYRNPFLSEPNCYGRTQFPFDYRRGKPIDYRLVKCPYGEELMSRGFSLSMLPNFTEEDITDIVKAIRKVVLHYKT